MIWKKFDKETIIKEHGDMYKYRDLYEGNHAEYSTRAQEHLKTYEIVDYLERGFEGAQNVMTPYVVLNVSKIICDIPSLLISRSLTEVKTNHKDEVVDQEQNSRADTGMIEGTDDDTENDEIVDLQQEMIDSIVDNSKLIRNHKSNIVQLLIDGGIVGVPFIKDGNVSIQFKERNIYFEHKDGLGVDLVYVLEPSDEDDEDDNEGYIHVYTERVERDKLVVTHTLYERDELHELVKIEDESFIKEKLGISNLVEEYSGRKRTFVEYLGNKANFINPYGVSELRGLENKQEEVNWTLTRMAMTLERNGKPRISVPRETMDALEKIAEGKFDKRIDHRDIEVTEINEDGHMIQTHQIDISKIGDMKYVKDVIRGMLAETNTSEKASELLNDTNHSSSGTSGIAKFYDLWISIVKSESIRDEYIEFLQNLFESALWLANKREPNIIIEKPIFVKSGMIPLSKNEIEKVELDKFREGVQSLETTVRNINPEKSDEWVELEVERIRVGKESVDSTNLNIGRQNLQQMLGNRDIMGRPLNSDGTPVDDATDDTTDGDDE